MSENPHLINITSTGDTQPVYIMGLGVFWNDLDDSEKETLYESQSYKLGRYQSAFWEVNKKLIGFADSLSDDEFNSMPAALKDFLLEDKTPDYEDWDDE